jgi:chromosome partitioning protein
MKGGVGKTTLAVNLAWNLTRRSARVLLVDLDPQFNSSQYLMDWAAYSAHARDAGTIANLLIDSPTLTLRKILKKPSVKDVICKVESDLHLLPSELALSHVVKNPAQMEYRLEKILEQIRDDYDFIFIDCAPTDSVLTTMALTASNHLVIPVRPDRFSILGFAMVLDTVRTFREYSNDPNKVSDLGVIFTQVRAGSKVEQECMQEIRNLAQTRKSYVFKSTLDFSATFGRAVQDQTPAFETRYAREELKDSINAIVDEMINRLPDSAG